MDIKNNITIKIENPSSQLINFLKEKEGFKAKPYYCPGNVLTIGYGHAIQEHNSLYKKITKTHAEQLLVTDILHTQKLIQKVYNDFIFLQPHQQDAIISLVFNWGIKNFSKSKLLKCLKTHNYLGAAQEFLDIVKVKGKIVTGLIIRRKEETDIFLNGW